MVLTVTLNPLLERRFYSNTELNSSEYLEEKEVVFAGGKGINVSRQLNKLGIKTHALTFMGGSNGKLLRQTLSSEGIEFSYIPTKSETRSALLTIDGKKKNLVTQFDSNPEITESEASEFINKFEKMIRNSSIVVFSGSSPSIQTNNIFAAGIELTHKYDKIAVLDTYGDHLADTISKAPLALHNNKEEVEKSLGWKLDNEQSYIEFLNHLNKNNIKLAFITDGQNPAYCLKFGFMYKVIVPQIDAINPTGSGDAFVAGIIYGLEMSMVFDDFTRTAAAIGTANALRWDACNVEPAAFEKYFESVQIIPIGKKVKLIDDSPNC